MESMTTPTDHDRVQIERQLFGDVVRPGKRLSYQQHSRRAEHRFVVHGEGNAITNGAVSILGPGDASTFLWHPFTAWRTVAMPIWSSSRFNVATISAKTTSCAWRMTSTGQNQLERRRRSDGHTGS